MALILSMFAVAAEPGAADVTLLDGTTAAGRVSSWNDAGLTVETPDGPREVRRAQLLDVRWAGEESEPTPATDSPAEGQSPATESIRVEFVDGTILPATEFVAARRRATVKTPLADAPLRVSVDRIARVHLKPVSDAADALWRQLDEQAPAGDVLFVANRDGTKLDYLAGVVGDVTADEVAFDYEGQQVKIKRPRVAAIAYYHAEAPRVPEAACELTLASGATVPVRLIELTAADGDGAMLRVATPAGVRLSVPLADVRRADFSAGKLAYLSDLKPTKVAWTPRIAAPPAARLIAGYGLPRNDASFGGSALTLAWPDESQAGGYEIRTYARGVALRSRTEVEYRLPPGMQRFTATAGIDPATADEGHVVLEIRADDRVVWEDEIDGRRAPVKIDLDLGSARRLHLRVDYGQNLDYGDRLHLVEARVTK